MRPVSNDKRADIIAAKKRKESVKTIKAWFNVSESTISRIWNQYLKTDSFLPIPYTGRKSNITADQDEAIRSKIEENCDITREKLISELQLNIKESGLSRHLKKIGLSLRKNATSEQSEARRCSPKT